MSRLIDADALKMSISEDANAAFYKMGDGWLQEIILNDINAAPTVDTAPVVRCRECRYVHQRGAILQCRGYRQTQPDDFCSRGAKMEGEA